MKRRHFGLVSAAGAAALLLPLHARVLGAEAALMVVPGERAQMLHRFEPAAGPLARHASRPGAWYALMYLPLAPAWPVQLLLWPAGNEREIVLTAFDAAPDEAPAIAHRLPVETGVERAGPPAWSSRFMLPAASQAPGIYVQAELRRIDGERPIPLWVQLRSAEPARGAREVIRPWWALRSPQHDAAQAPPSPLTQESNVRPGARVHEVPILALQPPLDAGVWR